jgi:hypothetical protein
MTSGVRNAAALFAASAVLLFACKKAEQPSTEQPATNANATNVELVSQKLIGTKLDDGIIGMSPANDGGYLLVGLSNYVGGTQTNQGDAWVVKVNANGDVAWNRTFGGSYFDAADACVATNDGGFLIAADTYSNNNGDVGANHGRSDWWIIKLKSNGDTAWTKLIGTTDSEYPKSIAVTPDGGFVVSGFVIDNSGNEDVLVAKFNNSGIVVWQKKFGGSGEEYGNSLTVTSDGSILVAGTTSSNNNNDVGANHGLEDCWILKLNANGDKIWSKLLGGSKDDWASTIKSTPDGGCIIACVTSNSENGDVKGKSHGNDDVWVVKLTSNGDISWSNLFGGANEDGINDNASIALTSDGGYAFAGYSKSVDGDLSQNMGDMDLWVFKLNSSGQKQWSRSFGGSGWDDGNGIIINSDGSFWAAGTTKSNNSGNVGTNAGMSDGWLLKLK